MPMKENEDEEFWTPAATIDREGKIDGLIVPKDQRREPASWQPKDEPLELDHRPPPEPPPEVKPRRDHTQAKVAISLVLAILFATAGVIAFVLRTRSPLSSDVVVEESPAPQDEDGARSLAIETEPSGATVIVNGEEMGRTPFLGSNDVARGKSVELRLELPGYKPWVGTLAGGTNARLKAKLKRR
jgi:hypothetical protein